MYESYQFNNVIQESIPDIKIIGIGGGGNNAISRMVEHNLDGVEFIAINTDLKALKNVPTDIKISIGEKLTHGLGTGSNPELGFQAARQCHDEISDAIGNADMVYLTASLGGGTGSGAILEVARIAKERNILTVAVVTKPFMFEGKLKMNIANSTIEELRKIADAIIVVPNEKLHELAEDELKLKDAFYLADNILFQAVSSLVELITLPGMINVDFADVKAILSAAGYTVFGVGIAEGESRAIEATTKAIASPLIETRFQGASRILVNVVYSSITLKEIQKIGETIEEWASKDSSIIFGTAQKDNMAEKISVTVIATGFQDDVVAVDKKTHAQIPASDVSFFDSLKAGGFIKTDDSYKTKPVETPAEMPRTATAAVQPKPASQPVQSYDDELDIPAFIRKQKEKQ